MAAETAIAHLTGGHSQSRRASELAESQFWAIARRQLLQIGLSPRQVDSWLQTGLLHPRYPGVYAYGRPELSERGELAASLLFAGRGSDLTGLSGLWWRGYLHRRPDRIHIDAPGAKRSRQDLRIHHPAEMQRVEHRGLPVAVLPRALLVASTDLSHDSLRLVLARAAYDGKFCLPSLQTALSGAPRGAVALRAAMDAHLPQLARCENGFERSFVLLCESRRLEIPDPNERIGRYRPDMLWRNHRLIAELDGEDAHSTAAQLISDARRQTHLESLGFTVIRFTWAEVTFRPEAVAAKVHAHLSAS